MNNAPLVYIPTQPESNGLTLPTLLSLIAHGIVLGLLLYTYQQPTLEDSGAIETTMISPEALAQMQGQILANRAAAQAASANGGESISSTDNSVSIQNSNQNNERSGSQSVPVFMSSDDPADDMSMSQQRTQQMQEYRDSVAEWATELDNTAMDKIEQVQNDKRADIQDERDLLQELRGKKTSSTMPNVKRPDSSSRNIEIETGSSGRTFDLADGDSTASSRSTSSSSGGGSSRSTGDFKKRIASKIQNNLNAPTETQGIIAKVFLVVDARGNVLSAKANGSNSKVNKAAEDAAFASSPLPIDLENPEAYRELSVNVKVE